MKRAACVGLLVTVLSGCPEASSPGPSDSTPVTTVLVTASTSAPTATASAVTSAVPVPTAAPMQQEDGASVAAKDTGVAGVGFELRGLRGQGWTVITLEGAFFAVSGPPGGPLGLQIRAYDEKSGDNAKLFESIVTHKPLKVGKAEKVELAGEQREAQSFRTGASLASTAYCLIRLPAKPGAKNGLVFLADSGMNEKDEPSCKKALDAPALKPIVASFKLVP